MIDTREALLEAGVRLYGAMASDLLRGLSAGNVAKEAGFHRQTFYRYWETQSEYVQDLMRHVLGAEQAPVADGAGELVGPQTPTDLDTFVRGLAVRDFALVAQDPRVALRIGLLVMDALSTEPLADQMQTYYDASVEGLVESYEALFAALDLEPADPATTRDLVRVVQAVLVGLVLQAKAGDDEPHAAVLYEWAARALIEGFTSPAGRSERASG
jgi:AcrR family transcriptional regulator